MPVVLARIDQRLVHGQVLSSQALASFKVNGVIIADAVLSEDYESQLIFTSALGAADVEFGKGTFYLKPEEISYDLLGLDDPDSRFLVLFRDASAALRAVDAGLSLDTLNLGNYHTLSPDYLILAPSFKVSMDEMQVLDKLSEKIPKLYFGSLDYDKHLGSRLYCPKKGKLQV
jgi:PTS system mannose-specific IIB component